MAEETNHKLKPGQMLMLTVGVPCRVAIGNAPDGTLDIGIVPMDEPQQPHAQAAEEPTWL